MLVEVVWGNFSYLPCTYGGIGRRSGLKILCPLGTSEFESRWVYVVRGYPKYKTLRLLDHLRFGFMQIVAVGFSFLLHQIRGAYLGLN